MQAAARQVRSSLVAQLREAQIVPPRPLAEAAAWEFGVPLVDLDAFDLQYAPVKDVSEKLIRRHRTLPLFKRGKRLFVAVSDLTNIQALDEIKFNTGRVTEGILVENDKRTQAIDNAL